MHNIEKLLMGVFAGCGGVEALHDAGHDATTDVAPADAHRDAPIDVGMCVDQPPLCCCFQYLRPCAAWSYTFDAAFPLCDADAEAGEGCVTNTDCTIFNPQLAYACQIADQDAGDPFPLEGTFSCENQSIDDAGFNHVQCLRNNPCGRRLEGLQDPVLKGPTPVARALAEMAWLEAASVRAFSRLARELLTHGAPRSLVARAIHAAREEARHARWMTTLARSRGAVVPRVVVRGAAATRPLARIALENAVLSVA